MSAPDWLRGDGPIDIPQLDLLVMREWMLEQSKGRYTLFANGTTASREEPSKRVQLSTQELHAIHQQAQAAYPADWFTEPPLEWPLEPPRKRTPTFRELLRD